MTENFIEYFWLNFCTRDEMNAAVGDTGVLRRKVGDVTRQMRLALLDHDLEMLSNLIRQLEEMADGI